MVHKPCRHALNTPVFTIGQARIFAGSKAEILGSTGWDFIFSLLRETTATALETNISVNTAAKDIFPTTLHKIPPVPRVIIDWPDQGMPILPVAWWNGLVQWLFEFNGSVAFHCFGGHGRTGTALAIIAALAGLLPKAEIEKKKKKNSCPVLWIRERYCKEAVESDEQLDYIQAITNRTVWADIPFDYVKPSKVVGGTEGPFNGFLPANKTGLEKGWGGWSEEDDDRGPYKLPYI